MTQAVVGSFALSGVRALPVEVQADVGPGLPSFSVVGLGDTAVLESRDRVRAAIRASGFDFPNARIVVNLAPAPIRKHGTGFDLPIALAILMATAQVPRGALTGIRAVGELSLDGRLRPVPGTLAHAVGAVGVGDALTGAHESAESAATVPGLIYHPVERLALFRRGVPERAVQDERVMPPASPAAPDLAEVVGQQSGKRVLELSAAAGLNVLLVGPPGGGKTMLARCLPGILPPLSPAEALETAVIHSVGGLDEQHVLAGTRPFRAPHHTASTAGLIGGGVPPRPGEVSLAHHGVLFLDEIAEFAPSALQSLRQPLEDGVVALVRAEGRVVYPASFTLVAAMNPCPCGFLGSTGPRRCTCSDGIVSRYHNRVGGPLMDRIDLVVRIDRTDPDALLRGADTCGSSLVRERITQARAFAMHRRGKPLRKLAAAALLTECRLTRPACTAVSECARTYALSGRGVTRLLRVARTIADMDLSDAVEDAHVFEAASYRAPL